MNRYMAMTDHLCADFGITVVWENNPRRMWCPKTKTIYRELVPDAIHELAHYLTVPPRFRRMNNFGLGSDYEFLLATSPAPHFKAFRGDTCMSEGDRAEQLASYLGIMIEKDFGLPWMETYREHGWIGCGYVRPVVAALKRIGAWDVRVLAKDTAMRFSGA